LVQQLPQLLDSQPVANFWTQKLGVQEHQKLR
jgi:hypothetical protein